MTSSPSRPPRAAGGVFIAFAVIVGAVLGARAEQPTIGVLAGFGLGLAIAILIWLVDRRR